MVQSFIKRNAMDIPKHIYQRIIQKHGPTLDLISNPTVLQDILHDLRSIEQDDFADYRKKTASPFNVPWMDSWAANWLLHQQSSQGQPEKEFNAVLRQLVDIKFRQRLHELKEFAGRYAEPPDAGPPEPGTPPAGPQAFFAAPPPPDPEDPEGFRAPPPPDPEDPDSSFFKSPTPPPEPGNLHAPPPDPEDPEGFRAPPPPDPEDPDSSFFKSPTPPPEPGNLKSPPPPPDEFRAPPPPDPEDPDSSFRSSSARNSAARGFRPVTEPPDAGPPEPGVPDPPNPGPEPPPGPYAGMLRENPWILYWFVSINAPLILNMIDAHISRRLNDLKMQNRKR